MSDRIYLDHAATTALVPAAIEAITRELERLGNPSSQHHSGRDARRVVEESRETIAAAIGAHPTEVIFTSGGTEADNLAIKGAFWAARSAEPARTGVAVSAIEHHAVLEAAEWLATDQGADLTLLDVDHDGRIDPELITQLGPSIAVVSTIWANNEVGTIQPVPEIAERAHRIGALAHSDAVQAAGKLPVDFAGSGLDLMTITGHKLGGPVGTGALIARRDARLAPVLHGGGQERDVRSGTLDVPGIAGFAAAVRSAVADRDKHAVRLRELRDRLTAGLGRIPDARVNGPADPAAPTDPNNAVPGIVSVCFPGCDADAVVLLLDQSGIDISAGAACSAGVTEPSHVMLAMGRSRAEALSTVRFSFGFSTTATEIDRVLAVLPEAIDRARTAGSLAG